MDQIGTVCAVENDTVKIRVQRKSACGENCVSCGACGRREMIICVENNGKLENGDRVRLISDDSAFLKRSAVGYLMLTGLLILGAAAGFGIGKSEIYSVAGALAALAVGVFVLRGFFKKDIDIKTEKIAR